MNATEVLTVKALLRRDGWPAAAAGGAAAAICAGAYWLLLGLGAGQSGAGMCAMMATAAWLAIMAPVLSAGARDWLGGLLRAGAAADGAGLGLLVLWLARSISLTGAIKVYCILVAMAMLGAAAGRLGRSSAARHACAAAAALAMLVAMASPFWIGGIMMSLEGQARQMVVAVGAAVSPVYSIAAATMDTQAFVWHQTRAMYEMSLFHDYGSPPPLPWYSAAVVYLLLAGITSAAAYLVSLRSRPSRQ